MSYLKLINEVDGTAFFQQNHLHVQAKLVACYKFMIHPFQAPFGYIDSSTVHRISWPAYWKIDHDYLVVELCCEPNTLRERSLRMNETLEWEREKGTLEALITWKDELCNVYGPDGEVVVSMDKAAAPLFGIIMYSVQMCVISKTLKGPKFWAAQRSQCNLKDPGMLEHFVSGPLKPGERPIEGIVRLATQNTLVSEEFIRAKAKPRGTITYCALPDLLVRDECTLLQPQVQYVYEIVAEQPLIPVARGLQVSNFDVLNAQELLQALQNRMFTADAVMTWVDAFVRNGNMDADNEKNFVAICMRLHRKFGLLGE